MTPKEHRVWEIAFATNEGHPTEKVAAAWEAVMALRECRRYTSFNTLGPMLNLRQTEEALQLRDEAFQDDSGRKEPEQVTDEDLVREGWDYPGIAAALEAHGMRIVRK